MKGNAKGGTKLNNGSYGIQALEAHWITNRQIEAARVALTRHMKRGGKVWITIFPDKPITQKPAEHLRIHSPHNLQNMVIGQPFSYIERHTLIQKAQRIPHRPVSHLRDIADRLLLHVQLLFSD